MNSLFRRTLITIMVVSLTWTTVACGGNQPQQRSEQAINNTTNNTQRSLPDGKYELQQASYDDVSGDYRLFLFNANPPVLERDNIKMARLTPEEVENGQNSYLLVENGEYSLHLAEDFRIEYIHGVAETRTDPNTGQEERVIVRRESNFWTPFAGALAGQAIGSLLFQPQYYVPPAYQSGTSVLTGYGGYGSTYSEAVDRYQDRYQSPPPSVQNKRAQVRTTGNINRSPSTNTNTRTRTNNSGRSTGSGVGTNTLRSNDSGKSSKTRTRKSRGSSFGSGTRSRSRSRGRRRR
ncbi:hypothetical protein PCC7418_2455 [Halothece sp. PCC 7418]|uniref:hypothetical protein n=1 Tax=Halothece sp. (strain PCC 7418) TaxID=65093 RepID=UPI0002A0746D|nr:hypothetical protein [Halothece sp. PCC 7418]AFZ44602.1 hypothetical protein PCC7418_2455 [Halothece sp. PCC 7418]